jgi:RNA polymerase sigma-70 factor (ECF subfamily)
LHEEKSGAAARLTSLYETYATDAFRFALHLTGRREDAEDVVQFVFLRAYGMLDAGTDLVNPRAWLMKATKHRSLNMLRDRREAPMAETDLPLGPRYDPDPAEAEALADVRSTLWALPESQHQAFVLRHWSGLSQDEIADVLSTTPGAVESLLVRARTTLVDDREQGAECAGVRRRLVQALAPTGGQQAHIDACRRCRTAQTRLLRAAEFATAFALVPGPHVAHGLASLVPGFSASTVAATTTATGAAGAGAGGGAGVATASAATKVALAAKIALATTTAVVALSAAHPVRRAVEHVVLGSPAHTSAAPPHHAAPAAGAAAAPGPAAAGQPVNGSPRAHPAHGGNGNGKAHGKGVGKSQTAGTGKGKAKGKPATPGSSGASHGKSATAGANGKATGKPATAGSQGKAKGKAKSKPAPASGGSSSSGGHGKGKPKG